MKLTYSEKLYIKAQIKWWGLFSVLIIILFFCIRYLISDNANFNSKTIEQLTIFLIGFVIYPIYSLITRKLDNMNEKLLKEASSAKLGFDGENTVAGWLIDILPTDKYIILPNVNLPDHIFDIDFVVIGPKGVIVLEVKNFSNQVKFYDNKYFLVNGDREVLLPQEDDPRSEIKRHTEYLRKYFESNNLKNIRILKAIVFPKNNAAVVSGLSGVWVASGFDSLKKFFEGASEDITYTQEFQDKIKNILILK